MSKNKVILESSSGGDISYLFLPKHPGKGVSGVVVKQVPLHLIVDGYRGPEIFLDFDKFGEIIGIEILCD